MNARELKMSDDALLRERDRQLGARSEKRKRTAPKRAAREASEAEEAALRAEVSKNLRRMAVYRSCGVGELCGAPLDPETAQMCHLDGGSGKRRQRQWIGNVVMEHPHCHQGKGGIDRDPMRWLVQVKAWAARYGYPLPERFRKLEALRSPPASPQETP